MELHENIMISKPDKWIGDKSKEAIVKREIRSILSDDLSVSEIFEIVKKQREYE